MASSTTESIQVAFENEYVRIVHVNLAAGETPPEYTPAAAPMVSVDLNSGNVRYIDTADDARRPGNAAVREIRVELKLAPKTTPLALDAVQVEPTRFKVVFENDRVRVVRLRFGPRERGAPAGVAAWLDTETLQTENARTEPLEVVLVEPKSAHGF